jgi:hypothetical protein
MTPTRVTKIAAGLHLGLAASAIVYTMRVNNDARLLEVSAKELAAMAGIALLPVVSAWAGLRLAHTDRPRRLLAVGQTLALILFAATFVPVVRSVEPMAPLLFMLTSIWLAAGLAFLLLVLGLLRLLER